jgi:hypothetical protein
LQVRLRRYASLPQQALVGHQSNRTAASCE